jgi:hypothetical protein
MLTARGKIAFTAVLFVIGWTAWQWKPFDGLAGTVIFAAAGSFVMVGMFHWLKR